jgi:hypothetical protein
MNDKLYDSPAAKRNDDPFQWGTKRWLALDSKCKPHNKRGHGFFQTRSDLCIEIHLPGPSMWVQYVRRLYTLAEFHETSEKK